MVQVFVAWTPDSRSNRGCPVHGRCARAGWQPVRQRFDHRRCRSAIHARLAFLRRPALAQPRFLCGRLRWFVGCGSARRQFRRRGNLVAGSAMIVNAWTFTTPSGTFTHAQARPAANAMGIYSTAPAISRSPPPTARITTSIHKASLSSPSMPTAIKPSSFTTRTAASPPSSPRADSPPRSTTAAAILSSIVDP